MELEFDRSFEKALEKIKDKKLFESIEVLIHQCEEASVLNDTKNVREIVGYSNYFRIRIGEYRIGIQFIKPNTIRFVTALHRKDIYKNFHKEGGENMYVIGEEQNSAIEEARE